MTSLRCPPGLSPLSASDLASLRMEARQAELGRARICLHQSHADQIQEMVIAVRQGSYIPPHRHVGRTESLHLIEGSLMAVFFDEAGLVTERLMLGGPSEPFLYRLASDHWHTILCLSDLVLFHETVCGPFEPDRKDVAPWAPQATDRAGIERFMARLLADGVPEGPLTGPPGAPPAQA